jgi:hypothetical protein
LALLAGGAASVWLARVGFAWAQAASAQPGAPGSLASLNHDMLGSMDGVFGMEVSVLALGALFATWRLWQRVRWKQAQTPRKRQLEREIENLRGAALAAWERREIELDLGFAEDSVSREPLSGVARPKGKRL